MGEKLRPVFEKIKLIPIKTAIYVFLGLILLLVVGPIVIPPKVSTSFPGNNSLDNPLQSKIEIIFDKQMNQFLTEKSFSITPAVAGSFSWETNQKLIFTPQTPLERGATYSVNINPLATSKTFTPLIGGYKISFATIGDPKVLVFSPQNESLEDYSPVTVVFDRPMIPLTTATNSAVKKPAFTISPKIEGEGRWLGTTAYQFIPSARLKKATTYNVTVDPGLSSVDGGSIKASFSWQFSGLRPHVENVSPVSGYNYASPTASIAAFFNQTIDQKSAASHFKVIDPNEIEIPGRVEVSNKIAAFYPNKPLDREKNYRVKILKGLQGTEGENGLEEEYNFSFSTAPYPAIVSTNPQNGASSIEELNTIKVVFNAPMDEKTFAENIFISPSPSTKPTYHFQTWDNANALQIGSYLSRLTNYTITFGPGIRDQYGVPLNGAKTISFTTAAYKPGISISPSGTYFASFNQQVIPRVVVLVNNSSAVNFNLYRLKQSDFVNLYQKKYGQSCGTDSNCYNWQNIDTSAFEKVHSWSEKFDQNPSTPINVVTKVTNPSGGNLPSGFYFLDASLSGGQHDNLVMIISKATMTVKKSPSQIFTWVVDQTTGQVIPNAKMNLTNIAGESLANGSSNSDGVWQQDVPNLDKTYDLLVFGESATDTLVASSSWGRGINGYDFGLPSYYNSSVITDYEASSNRFRIYATLDRPIYRPGNKVYFKGVLRKDNDAAYENLPPGEKVEVLITDANQRQLYTTQLTTNSFGSFADSFTLSEKATLGRYRLQLKYKQNGVSQDFQVEEFRRPDMLLTIKPTQDQFIYGQLPSVKLNTSYYFGAPLTQANIRWQANTADYNFTYSKDWRFEFGDPEEYWSRWWGGQYNSQTNIGSGTVKTNDSGDAIVNLPLNFEKIKTSQRVSVSGEVTDLTNQYVGSENDFIVHRSNIYVGIKSLSYSGSSGQQSSVQVIAVDPNGKELQNVPVDLRFYRRTWTTARELNPETGTYQYVSNHSDVEVGNGKTTTNFLGIGESSFVPNQGGTYRVMATATDSSGNQSKASTYIWISGDGYEAARENNDRIILAPDKKEYSVGETAKIFVNTPFASASATTLITAERSKVLGYKVVSTNATSNNFPVTINQNYSPNIYLGAVLVKPGSQIKDPPELKVGYAEVKVSDAKQQLKVEIQTDKQKYHPGDTLQATITTKDAFGNPVAAEMAVGLVDKSVWDLATINLPEIYQFFYQPRNLEIDTSQLLTISMDRINANTNLGAKGGSGGCFTGDTQVLMANNKSQPISKIKVGDEILTKKTSSSSDLTSSKVTKVFTHLVDRYLILNNKIKVTPVHLVFANNSWKMAGLLKVGDILLDSQSKPIRVNSIDQIFAPNTVVYNLEVASTHTYFAENVYVHNCKGGDGPCFIDTSRKNFPETAYWNPAVTTSANGQTSLSIKLPDNLTTWRLAAIANTNQAVFGSTVKEFLVSQDVVIRPLMPRFLSVGDQANLGAVVINTSSQSQNLTISLSSLGTSILSSSAQFATVAPGQQHKFLWNTATQATQSSEFRFWVTNNDGALADSIKVTLPVKSYSVFETVATAGQAKDTATEKILLPNNVDKTSGRLDVTLSPSLGASSLESMDWLIKYSYYCTEQITSKMLPAIYSLRLLKKANLDKAGPVARTDLEEVVSDSIQRLNNSQHSDGGYGWWIDSQSDPMMTAYAFIGLSEVKKDKYAIADDVYQKTKSYLLNKLNSSLSLNLVEKTYIVYSLKNSGENLDSYLSDLYSRRFELPIQSRALLVISLKQNGFSSQADRLSAEIISLAKKTATSVHWEESGSNAYWFGTTLGATSAVLQMLTATNPNHPMIPEAIRYLLSSRNDNYWANTYQTAAVITSVINQVLATNPGSISEDVRLSINGQSLTEAKLTSKDLLNLLTASVEVKDLKIGTENNLVISKSGQGNLYYNLNLRYFLPFNEIKSLDQGLVVVRELIDADSNILPGNQINEGDQAWIRLTVVSPALREYVTLEDYLPAGLESANESLKNVVSVSKEPPKYKSQDSDNQFYEPTYFDHKEYHDDRTTLFARYLPAGVYQVTYKVRATTPGRYHHMPAQAYEMYFPDVSGHSDGGWFSVVPKM